MKILNFILLIFINLNVNLNAFQDDYFDICQKIIKDPSSLNLILKDTSYCSKELVRVSIFDENTKYLNKQLDTFKQTNYVIDSSYGKKRIIFNNIDSCSLKLIIYSNNSAQKKLLMFGFYKFNSNNWKISNIIFHEDDFLEENFIEKISLDEPIDKINQIIKDPNNITHLELEYYDLINKNRNQNDSIKIKRVQNIVNDYVNKFKSYSFNDITEFVLNFGDLENEKIPFITITLCNKNRNKLVFQFVSRDLINWKFLSLNNEEEQASPQ